MADVGFLGLGSMGMGMARRLIAAGHTVHVWNRSKGPVEALVAQGATEATTPAEALATKASFSMLANDSVAEMVLSEDNLRAAEGGFHANMASVSPECGRRLSDLALRAGVSYLASPVLGRPAVAAEGNLNILAAGSPDAIAAAQPFFEVMGQKTWPMGDSAEVANLVKVAVNYNIIHAIQALGESIALVETAGVDASDFVELLSNTLFGGVVYQGYGNLIAQKEYLPQSFSLELGLKDLSLAEGAAQDAGITLPTSGVLRSLFEAALASP
ncbi:MAG: NAD(P)-dependent oxidoreductase, partial [Microbacteriaceae bacterium]|nr:NAD(P)-dependent oxidoreductase [Microbacteriaceae bacterium]